jgi:hypothetical protein
VGGQHLALLFDRLDDDGVVQAIGVASGQPMLIDFEVARTRSTRGRLENFNLHTPVGPDLTFLVGLMAQGRLDPQIGWRGPWDRAPEAAEALLSRQVRGKVVLDLPRWNLGRGFKSRHHVWQPDSYRRQRFVRRVDGTAIDPDPPHSCAQFVATLGNEIARIAREHRQVGPLADLDRAEFGGHAT